MHMATLTKRGKYWRAQVRRLGFPPQSKTFDTNSEAEAWARATESKMDRGIVSRAEAERTTFAEALERYSIELRLFTNNKRFIVKILLNIT